MLHNVVPLICNTIPEYHLLLVYCASTWSPAFTTAADADVAVVGRAADPRLCFDVNKAAAGVTKASMTKATRKAFTMIYKKGEEENEAREGCREPSLQI
jgi:hypothetical protein